jgi:chromosome partitioning protein
MGLPASSSDREKIVTELPEQLKARAGQFGRELESIPATIDTAGAESFATFLPIGQWAEFRSIAQQRRVPLVQGVAQAVHMWLEANRPAELPRRDSIILG